MAIDSIVSARPAERPAAGADAAAYGVAQARATPLETRAAVKSATTPPSLEQVTDAVTQLNKSLQIKAQSLEFSIDTESKRTIVKLIDQKTKEVLRQIPTPEALELAKSLDAAGTGQLIKQTA